VASVTGDGSGAAAAGPAYVLVPHLDDLISADEYADHEQGRLVRLRITTGAGGVEILGDAFRPEALEALLAALGADVVEQMLCG
jgi:FtsH ternary system-associated peptide